MPDERVVHAPFEIDQLCVRAVSPMAVNARKARRRRGTDA
jgi:hypothetical protein